MSDTIAAVSTPIGEGGIAIVRVSGPDAIEVADKVLRLNTPLRSCLSHTIHYGHLLNADGVVVDEIITSVMRAPRSYTREDTVEINCHAGSVAAAQALQAVLAGGARVADPGEFTKRAFLNGRIDLTQAEGVTGVIRAQTEQAFRVAQTLLAGRLTAELDAVSNLLLRVATHIEANLDFADDDIEPADMTDIAVKLEDALGRLKALVDTGKHGQMLENGAVIAIVGKPNVGKSSLLNAFLGQERAIVDKEPGTTRDTVEGRLSFGGIPAFLIDTAGVRDAEHPVEVKGVKKSWEAMERSDLVLWVFDGSRPLEAADNQISAGIRAEIPCISVSNKSDLGIVVDGPAVPVSAITGEGMDILKAKIIDGLGGGRKLDPGRVILGSARQRRGVNQAAELIAEAQTSLKEDLGEEIVSELVREALREIGEITGKNHSEELLDSIFSTFCIGK